MSYIELKNIEKSYGKKIVLKNFNLSVERGEFVGIQGESGKGEKHTFKYHRSVRTL